jgi:DNA-binding NarL/FixJ family response regulator
MNPIRVITVDDLPVMRSGLRAFLSAYHEFSLVGEASNGEEAVQLCELVKPDVIVMDLKMPVMDGVAATRQILDRWPAVKILALVSFRDNELVEEALNAGASAYAFKDLTADELVDNIRRMCAGSSSTPDSLRHSPEQTEMLERLGQAMDMASTDRTLLAD